MCHGTFVVLLLVADLTFGVHFLKFLHRNRSVWFTHAEYCILNMDGPGEVTADGDTQVLSGSGGGTCRFQCLPMEKVAGRSVVGHDMDDIAFV